MSLWSHPRSASPVPPPLALPHGQLMRHVFRGWTESLFVTGAVRGGDRLLDVFNLREPLAVEDAAVLPHGANHSALVFSPNAVFDPLDFDVVLGGELDPRSAAERHARRVYKVQYPVVIEGRDFEVRGIMHVFPGNAPEFAMIHASALFMPITRPVVRRHRRLVSDANTDVALVNRFAVTSIAQLDGLN